MKPAGDGPFPVIVYNHGSEQDPSLQFQGDLGRFFQKEGYIAFFPYRRGASGSEGPYWEDEIKRKPGTDRARKIVEQLEVENADVVAALAWVRQQPAVDARHIAVAGCSFGGIHTLLASEKATAAYAAVDFAGASMSWETSEPLQVRLKTAARAAQIPVFLVQAENDFNTAPSRVLSAEMDAAHKPHLMKIFPPHGTTPMAGHAHFCNHGMKEWGPEVLAFLRAPPAP
jgi:dienelactone hydrolase